MLFATGTDVKLDLNNTRQVSARLRQQR